MRDWNVWLSLTLGETLLETNTSNRMGDNPILESHGPPAGF
jgi:hypothetical protein